MKEDNNNQQPQYQQPQYSNTFTLGLVSLLVAFIIGIGSIGSIIIGTIAIFSGIRILQNTGDRRKINRIVFEILGIIIIGIALLILSLVLKNLFIAIIAVGAIVSITVIRMVKLMKIYDKNEVVGILLAVYGIIISGVVLFILYGLSYHLI